MTKDFYYNDGIRVNTIGFTNKFKGVILSFRFFYNLDKFNLKEIGKYLWQLGKEKFPRNYS